MEFHPQIPMQQGDGAPVRGRHFALLVVAAGERPGTAVYGHPICIVNTQRSLQPCIQKPTARLLS